MAKNLLVIGSGGREHAICWKLSQSSKVGRIFALPGSVGIAKEPKTTCISNVKIDDFMVCIYLFLILNTDASIDYFKGHVVYYKHDKNVNNKSA